MCRLVNVMLPVYRPRNRDKRESLSKAGRKRRKRGIELIMW